MYLTLLGLGFQSMACCSTQLLGRSYSQPSHAIVNISSNESCSFIAETWKSWNVRMVCTMPSFADSAKDGYQYCTIHDPRPWVRSKPATEKTLAQHQQNPKQTEDITIILVWAVNGTACSSPQVEASGMRNQSSAVHWASSTCGWLNLPQRRVRKKTIQQTNEATNKLHQVCCAS